MLKTFKLKCTQCGYESELREIDDNPEDMKIKMSIVKKGEKVAVIIKCQCGNVDVIK